MEGYFNQGIYMANGNTKTLNQFIEKATEIHADKYDYSESIYTNCKVKIKIFCKSHQDFFWQTPDTHIQGRGCKHCSDIEGHKKLTLSHEEFLYRAIKTHENRYTYNDVVYIRNNKKVYVTCLIHGNFSIAPANLFLGKGCPNCAEYGYNLSKPASLYILKQNNITKIGITNRDVLTRVEEINKTANKNFEIIWSKHFNDGSIPFCIEYAMKHYLNALYKAVAEKYNGSTECFEDVDYRHIIKMAEQHIQNIERLKCHLIPQQISEKSD